MPNLTAYRALIAMAFALIETAYFGWNLVPKSDTEIICDGLVCVLLSLALRVAPKSDGAKAGLRLAKTILNSGSEPNPN